MENIKEELLQHRLDHPPLKKRKVNDRSELRVAQIVSDENSIPTILLLGASEFSVMCSYNPSPYITEMIREVQVKMHSP